MVTQMEVSMAKFVYVYQMLMVTCIRKGYLGGLTQMAQQA